MSTKTSKFCDLCGDKEESLPQRHWSDAFGPIDLNLKGIPGVQLQRTAEDVCRPCGVALSDAIEACLSKIREKHHREE